MNEDRIKEGVLCQLKIGRWSAITTLPKNTLGKTVPKEIIRITQDLVPDRTVLTRIGTIRREAKVFLQSLAMPFPIRGVYWVYKDEIEMVNDFFKRKELDYKKRVNTLCEQLPNMKKEFKTCYPDFYNEKYYPSNKELRRKFYFVWNFFSFNIPDKASGILLPEIYKKEKEKFYKMMQEMEEITINIIANSLIARVKSLSVQCKNKKIKSSSILGINRILKRWEDNWKDNIDEKQIKKIMKQVKADMKKISPEKLNGDVHFQSTIKTKMDKIVQQIKLIPNVKLKRKIDT